MRRESRGRSESRAREGNAASDQPEIFMSKKRLMKTCESRRESAVSPFRSAARAVRAGGTRRRAKGVARIGKGALLALFFAGFAALSRGAEQPNVIVIFTDDQGYADVGAQGRDQAARTPHIDRLAREGVRFTSGYVTAPVCGPSRAALLSGEYQQRFGIYLHRDMPFRYQGIPVPERLRRVGYRTGMVGKLHLPVQNARGGESPAFWGFDEFFMKSGAFREAPRRHKVTHTPDGRVFPDGKWMDVEGYRTTAHTDAAVDFIDRHRDAPFFLYLAYFAPHTPLEAPDEYLARFAHVEPQARRYALAMIAAIDDGVGRITERLKKHGIRDETIIYFISDNGAPIQGREDHGTVSELKAHEWNGSLNAPLTGEKGMLTEGGIRVPFIVNGPGYASGVTVDEPVITLDVAATVLATAGAAWRDLDGVNLRPLLTGSKRSLERDALFWAYGGQFAVRSGNWKWIRTQTSGDFLFKVGANPAETRNRVEALPERAAELADRLERWRTQLPEQRKPIPSPQLRLEERLYEKHLGGEIVVGDEVSSGKAD